MLRAERARDERVARHVARPRFAERAREREQHRARRERDHRAPRRARRDGTRRRRAPSTRAALRRPRAGGAAPRRRAIRRAAGAFSTRDALSTSAVSAGMRACARGALGRARAPRAPPSCAGAASRCRRPPARGRPSTRAASGAGSSAGERALGLVEAPDQQQAPDLEMPRMRGVHAVAVRFERRPRRVERLRRPAQVARDERDLGLGDDAPRARHGLLRTEGARRASQQRLRAREIAELRHRDAAQRERRRIVAQRDALQRAERITRRERARRGRDQRVHRNPATLVTPTVRCPR